MQRAGVKWSKVLNVKLKVLSLILEKKGTTKGFLKGDYGRGDKLGI